MLLNAPAPVVISLAITAFIALPFHELAHAWTADRLGDDTPRLNGRLTLNPLRHLDPLGSILLVAAGFGWAKPVPISPFALQRRSPAGVFLVSLAGPLSNLVLAAVAAVPFRVALDGAPITFSGFLPTLPEFMLVFIRINLVLLVFNLLPIAPLDGEKVLTYLLPSNGQATMARIRPYGPLILMLLVVLSYAGSFDVLGLVVGTPVDLLLGLLIG